MEIKQTDVRHFVSIEYPGNVVNTDKAVETLGGIEELSKGFQQKQKLKLQLRQNFYAKAVFSSEPNDATGMLLKVKVRKSKKHPERKPEFVSAELAGTVSTMYKFGTLADYQYLPIQKNEKTGITEYIYDDIVPTDITVGPAWLRDKLDVPIFLPPAAFTRCDTVQYAGLKNEDEADDNVQFAITNRISRTTNGVSVPFSMTDPVPAKPLDAVKDLVKCNIVTQEEYDKIAQLFADRPIWTLASVRAHLRNPPKRLNYVLAPIAFYFTTGPWRNCYCRFGYDPRKDFKSRFYQMLDFRVRQGAGIKGEMLLNRKGGGWSKLVKVAAKVDNKIPPEEEIERNYQLNLKLAIFNINTIPPFRARHYQFQDIDIPKVQEMLEKIPNPLSGAVCNEKRGWLPIGFIEQCRDILTAIAQANMIKLCSEKNISPDDFKADDETKSDALLEDFSDTEETENNFPEDA